MTYNDGYVVEIEFDLDGVRYSASFVKSKQHGWTLFCMHEDGQPMPCNVKHRARIAGVAERHLAELTKGEEHAT